MSRWLVLSSILLSFTAKGTAQGIATNDVERSAMEMLVDFAVMPNLLPDEYAAIVRENQISYIDGTESDMVYLFCEDRRKVSSTRFSATGVIRQDMIINGELRRWVQYLRTPTHRAQRQGGPAFGRYSGEIVEEVTMDPEDSRILKFPPGHDFVLFRPLAPAIDRSRGSTHSAGYGRLLLEELDFMGAKKMDDGTIQSNWARKLWRVQITFDPKQGNCPTRIVHFSDLEIEKPGPIVCVHVVDWVKWEPDSGVSLWVPGHYRFRHSTPAFNSDYETEGYLRWANTSKASVIPALAEGDGSDWREKIRVRFQEDWLVRYDEWVNRNKDTGVFIDLNRH